MKDLRHVYKFCTHGQNVTESRLVVVVVELIKRDKMIWNKTDPTAMEAHRKWDEDLKLAVDNIVKSLLGELNENFDSYKLKKKKFEKKGAIVELEGGQVLKPFYRSEVCYKYAKGEKQAGRHMYDYVPEYYHLFADITGFTDATKIAHINLSKFSATGPSTAPTQIPITTSGSLPKTASALAEAKRQEQSQSQLRPQMQQVPQQETAPLKGGNDEIILTTEHAERGRRRKKYHMY